MTNTSKAKVLREQVKVWFAPELDNLELLSATYVTHSFAPHTHSGFAISVIEQGVQEFQYQGKTHTASAGDLVIISPEEVHTGYGKSANGWTYRMLYPTANLLQTIASEISGQFQPQPNFLQPIIKDKQLFRLFRHLHRTLEKSIVKIEQESNLLWILSTLIHRHSEKDLALSKIKTEHQAVKQVREYMEDCYTLDLSLDQLASIANLSTFHLCRVFRNEVGIAPHTYLTQLRINRAKYLLSKGIPIVQVASDTGFVDQSHLTKKFKRYLGITPGKYKASNN